MPAEEVKAGSYHSNRPIRCIRSLLNIRNIFQRRRRHIRTAKKLFLPQEKLPQTRCLQFAARAPHGVNVRAMQESQTQVKYLTRRLILWRTTPRLAGASPSNASQGIEPAC